MLDKTNIPPASHGHPQVEYYKALAHLAEKRARDIRRISALERARLEERIVEREPPLDQYAAECDHLRRTCRRLTRELEAIKIQLHELRQMQDRLARSRAHRLADAYVRHATSHSLPGRMLRAILRPLARILK